MRYSETGTWSFRLNEKHITTTSATIARPNEHQISILRCGSRMVGSIVALSMHDKRVIYY